MTFAVTGKGWGGMKVWRCQVCFRVNTGDVSVCEQCALPRDGDMQALDQKCSLVAYGFQAMFLLVAIGVAASLDAKPPGYLLNAVVAWWGGLAVFSSSPFGGNFLTERAWVKALVARQVDAITKGLVRCAFYVCYWPIFIPQAVYFWVLMLLAGAHLLWKYVLRG